MVVRAFLDQEKTARSDLKKEKKKQYVGFKILVDHENLVTISCFRTFLIFIQSYIFIFCIYFKCFFLYLYYIYIYISCEISIEHPSVGLASLAQLEKWFPLQGKRAHSLYFLSFQDHQNREVGVTEQQQIYQFTQGYNNFHRLQVHHLSLIFIIHNKYISTLYLYTYIHI